MKAHTSNLYKLLKLTTQPDGSLLSNKQAGKVCFLLGYEIKRAKVSGEFTEFLEELVTKYESMDIPTLEKLAEEELHTVMKKEEEKMEQWHRSAEEAKEKQRLQHIEKENEICARPSAFKDIKGLALSTLTAGEYLCKKFWEEHWTEETKDATRTALAKAGLVITKVSTPENNYPKSISFYKIAKRKTPRHEKLFAQEALPSSLTWADMSKEQREEFVENNSEICRKAGVTASEIKGISDRHIYEVMATRSRAKSRILARDFRFSGKINFEFSSEILESLGLSNEDLSNLPINTIKGIILAYSEGKVTQYWANRGSSNEPKFSDMYEEFEFFKSLWRGEFDALEVEYDITISPARKREFEALLDKFS